jgi:hypothetical protein
MSSKNLEDENKKLHEENEQLKKSLLSAKLWMEKEVQSSIKKIAKSKLTHSSLETEDEFFNNRIENMITERVSNFF